MSTEQILETMQAVYEENKPKENDNDTDSV